jgi:uncharacterized protein with NAD-binding domain and iron-sulfur cluster
MALKKIAVLGGGMGSLTAVLRLTENPDWAQQYDITIYQMGWRLGGKGASGRNALAGQRIEEHGLHLWFGFYDNAFDLIQKCYIENNRPPGSPLATWQEAFTGYDSICLEEQTATGWEHWLFTVPSNNQLPGIGQNKTIWELIFGILEVLMQSHHHLQPRKSNTVEANIAVHQQSPHMGLIRSLVGSFFHEAEHTFADAGEYLLYAAQKLVKELDGSSGGLLKELMLRFKEWLKTVLTDSIDTDDDARRFLIMADFGATIIIGMIEDEVLEKGFNVINVYDFREWLVKHGAVQPVIDSAIVQAVYGLVFGGKEQYTFEAGSALRGLLRMGLTYRGHVYYRMMAGMGDAIFGPIYEVLQKRGVQIDFFNKVTNLNLAGNTNTIESIDIDVQAPLRKDVAKYDPLTSVNGLPCWPNVPKYGLLEQGTLLQNNGINLESYYADWKPVATKKLVAGTDFDLIVLGISIGALPTIASQLIANSTAWQNMIQNVVPVSTIAYQLWLGSSIGKMEWPYSSQGLALLGSYQEPYDTWADMSDLIPREDWPEGYTPKNIAYFCGPTPSQYAEQIQKNVRDSNFTDASFPAAQNQMTADYALDYVQTLTPHIWPGIAPSVNNFDFSQLIDLKNGSGQERFQAQFFRANIDPTELYVMSFTNSTPSRLKTDDNGFANLYITGDWIECGLNAGCIEATVIAGLRTARAIMGADFPIPGEND